jgi:hypothetical protein
MKIDLNSGAFIQIDGEMGKYHTLPIETLIKIAQTFQDLVMSIARFDLETTDPVNLDNFKIELAGFKEGSAVPEFIFSPRAENMVGHNWQIHRNQVTENLTKLAEVSNTGDYYKLKALYPLPEVRNHIVENFYSFVSTFGSTPVNFAEYNESTGKIIPISKINRFKPAVRKALITLVEGSEKTLSETNDAVGKIKITKRNGKTSKKIMNYYSNSKFSLEYAPSYIVFGQTRYDLKYPLRCMFEKEDGYHVIKSEALGIIGTGLTEDEAEKSFAEEFDYIFRRFNSLDDKSLTKRNKLIKDTLNQLVKS